MKLHLAVRTAYMESGFLKDVWKIETEFLCRDHRRIPGGVHCPLVHGTYIGKKLKFLDYRRMFSFKSWYVPHYKISIFSWMLMEAVYSKMLI